jgi:hypothetical protein
MNKLDFSEEALILLLDLEEGAILKDIIVKIAELRGQPITLKPLVLPGIVSGCTIHNESGYQIFYEEGKKGREYDITILHELAHILRGDLDLVEPIAEKEFLEVLVTKDKCQDWAKIAVMRSSLGFDAKREKLTERLACAILEKLVSPRQKFLEKNNQLWLLD